MDLAKKILDKKFHCVFISPHFDDAILSCGSLLSQLSGKTDITIVNVFTKAHSGRYTLSQQQFLKTSGVSNADTLYEERQTEDARALSRIFAKIINFGFEDALFREKKLKTFLGNILPEFDHLYPTYRFHMLKGISKDDYAVSELKKKLLTYKQENTVVFATYGIGNHVDHLIVRKVCEELFENVILYSDFPYNVRLHDYGNDMSGVQVYTIQPDMRKKSDLIKLYKTQFLGLFPDGNIPDHKEMYFSKYIFKS